jgi:hypothetical protein
MFLYMTINNSSLFMSLSNSTNINIMDMKRCMLIYLFIFMLVDRERGEIVIRIVISFFLKKIGKNMVVIKKEVR